MPLIYTKRQSRRNQLQAQEAAAELPGKANINSPALTGEPTVNGVRIATTAQPIAYDIPFVNGTSAYTPSKYWLTQDGEVKFTFRANVSEQLISGQAIAILPEGYRTAFMISDHGSIYRHDTGKEDRIHVDFIPNGEIRIFFDGSIPKGGVVTVGTITALAAR